MATKTITTPYQWAAVKGSNTNYTQTYSFTNTTGKAITIKSIKVSLAEYPGKGNSGNLYTWEESSSNDRKSFTTSRNPRTTEYGGYDTRAEAETAGNNGFKKYLYNYLNESTEHISSIDLSQTDYMQLTEIEIGGTNIGITAQNIKNTATGVKNTYTFDTSNVNYEIREAVISGEIVYSAVWTSGKATIKSGRLDSGGKDYAFSCEKLVASGASANVLITVNNPNANWAAVKFGSVTITYDSYDPTFPDNGPYYPWVKGYNGTDWKLPKANIVSGIGDYKVRTSSGVWKPALASKDNYVYEAERGWIKYQKYINLPGTEGQHFDLADDKRFNLIAGNSVEFDISMPYQLVSGHGYMLLESHNSSGNLRIGVYSNDGSSMYAYLKNTVGTATEIRTPESGHGVLQPNTRYKIVYGKDSSNAYIRVFDEFGDLYTEVTGTVNNFTGSTATRLFNDVSLSSEDRNFKGYCYYFKVNNDIFDIDCCSVGYDHIKQTNYNEAGEFESDSYLANDIHTIVEGEWVEKPVEPDKPWMPLRFTANTNNSTVELTKVGNPSIANTAYSLDGYTWTTFTPGEVGSNTITLAHAGDKVYFRNDITGHFDGGTNHIKFVMSGSIAAAGNINSIYSSTAFRDLTELSYVYCYGRLFFNCAALTTPPLFTATTLSDGCYWATFDSCTSLSVAPVLPAMTMKSSCYMYMFCGCTSLHTPPELPATTLATECYAYMFLNSWTGLTTAPELPATTLADSCYYRMFSSCIKLETAPALQATTLSDHCYEGMFWGCSSLTAAPELPATTLAPYCYSKMFVECTSLTSPPELRATTLAEYCYKHMFGSCLLLDVAPELPATTLSYGCYWAMFDSCPSLKVAPELPATTLADHCYYYMFYGCTSLTTPPELQATILEDYCYGGMFCGCISLTTSPELKATTLASSCYRNMFYDCSALSTPPELPATTLSDDCYRGMFYRCTSLASPSELPATTLASGCYWAMFYGCTSLTNSPELKATTLSSDCYRGMFSGCTSLATSPALPATTLASGCYWSMFYGCTSLTTPPELPATTLSSDCYRSMFSGCTSLQVSDTQTEAAQYVWTIPESGIFTNTTTYNQLYMFTNCLGTRSSDTMSGAQGESHTYYTQNEPIGPAPTPTVGDYLSLTAVNSTNLYLTKEGSSWVGNPTLQYKINNGSWADYTFNTAIALTAGDKIYWKGDNESFSESPTNYIHFTADWVSAPDFIVSGNIMSLVDSSLTSLEIPNDYCFCILFSNYADNAASVTTDEDFILPATTLKPYCYMDLLSDSNISIAPELPATTLEPYCYYDMFAETLLTSTPELPATTMAKGCYKAMFVDCWNLQTINHISAEAYEEECFYNMFCNCPNLKQIPALIGTYFPSNCCAYMFEGCQSLQMYTTSGGQHTTEYRIPISGIGTAASNAFTEMFLCPSDLEDGTPSINTTYYTNATIV